MHAEMPYIVVFGWGLLLLASFCGIGAGLTRALRIRDSAEIDLGLLAGWGMALVLGVGGWLCAFSLATRPVLIGLALCGAAATIAELGLRFRSLGAPARPRIAAFAWVVPGAAVATLLYASAISPLSGLNPNDDPIAYLTFPRRMLETGGLVEPFGLRRMYGLGGHSLLQALVMAMGSEYNANLVDMGFGAVLLLALLAGLLRPAGRGPTVAASVFLLVVMLLPVPRANTSSSLTGMVMLVVLYRTLHLMGRSPAGAGSLALLAGLAAGAAGSLRATYLAAGVLALGIFSLARLRVSAGIEWQHTWRFLASGLFVLVPWMLAMSLSSRTPLLPFLTGNYNTHFDTFSGHLGFAGTLSYVTGLLASPGLVVLWLPFLLVPGLRARLPGLALAPAVLIACVLMADATSALPQGSLTRYAWPLLGAASLPTLALVVREWSEERRGGPRSRFAVAGAGLCLALIVLQNLAPAGQQLRQVVARLPAQWTNRRPPTLGLAKLAYAEAQAEVPEGAAVLTVVERPFLFDYRRNPIRNVDVIGGASPPPGMPFFQGPAALREYLLDQSIEWVMARDFDVGRSLYSRAFFRQDRPLRVLNEVWRPYSLDLMANLDELARCAGARSQAPRPRVIDLRAPCSQEH